MEDLTGLGKIGIALVEALKDATRGVFAPSQIKRIGRAETERDRHRALEAARTEIEVNRMKRHAEAEAEADAELFDRTVRRLGAREVTRQINLEAVIEESLLEAREADAEAAEPRDIEQDWIMAFMDYAQNVSNSGVRAIWARILAQQGTEGAPTMSRATLDALRLVEAPQAEMFQRAMRLYLGMGQIMDVDPFGDNDIAFNMHMHTAMALEDLGFLRRGPSRETGLEFHDGVFSFWLPNIPVQFGEPARDWLEDEEAREVAEKYIWRSAMEEGGDPLRLRTDIRVDRYILTSLGFELAATLFDGFYDLLGKPDALSEELGGPFSDITVRGQVLSDWAAGLAPRGARIVLNAIEAKKAEEVGTGGVRLRPIQIFDAHEGTWTKFNHGS